MIHVITHLRKRKERGIRVYKITTKLIIANDSIVILTQPLQSVIYPDNQAADNAISSFNDPGLFRSYRLSDVSLFSPLVNSRYYHESSMIHLLFYNCV